MTRRRRGTWLVASTAVVVAATVAAALVVIGPPSRQRLARLDERRVEALQDIDRTVRALEARDKRLPSLHALATAPGLQLDLADPQTRRPYGYSPRGADGFRLCATFDTDTAKARPGRSGPVADGWHHAAGPQCFDRVIERD